MPTSNVTTVDLPAIEQGSADGVPVILLHGLTDSMRSYEPVLAHLPDTVHAYALTLRGHGDAPKPAANYAAGDFGGDVIAFMDAADIERAVVVGHSMGAWVASRLAVDHPERLLGLVLVGALSTFRDRPDLDELLEAMRTVGDPLDPAFLREFQESTLAQPVPAAFLDLVVAESGKVPAQTGAAVLETMIAAEPEPFEAIRAPSLLVWGEDDTLAVQADRDAISAAMPAAERSIYAGGGHAMHWEEPARFAAQLARFAQDVAR